MKNKKIISLVLSITLVITSVMCIGFNAFANDEIHFSFDENTKTLTLTGSGAMTDYTQDSLNQTDWYEHRNKIVNVIVGEGITHIGDYAFCREISLENVSLPSTLKSIGTAAFAGNDKLQQLTIPESVEEVGDYAFGYKYDMTLNTDFVAYCTFNSAAQKFCIRNYVPFDVPFSDDHTDKAVTLSENRQSMWSFVPRTDGIITFWSTGKSDTYGLIYDADNYAYSSSFDVMRKSALAENDDDADDRINFRLSCELKAGKRYYLSAKFTSPKKNSGSFDVHISFDCTKHLFNRKIITEPDCINDGEAEYTCLVCGDTYRERMYALGHIYKLSSFSDGIAGVQCDRCTESYEIRFSDYINKENPILDVIEDNIINAKDYSKLIKMFR